MKTSEQIIKWTGKKKPNKEDLDSTFKNRNLNYYRFSNSEGDHYAAHKHAYNKFLVIAKGKMKWTINGKTHVLKSGDAIVLPKDTTHEAYALEDCECMEAHF